MNEEVKSTDAERLHHPFSPSTLQARELCPKYTPRGGTSEAAEAGTRQHSAVELEEDDDVLEDNQAIAVASCVAFCDNLIKRRYDGKPGHDIKEGYWPVDGKRIRLQVPSDDKGGIKSQTFKGTTAGYADRVFVSKCETFADVVDWKFGMFEVTDAEHNLQGIAYMLGVARKFPKVERVTVHFISPHRDEWTFHTFTRDSFGSLYVRIIKVVRDAINAAIEPHFESARPSPSACMFCGHLAKCTKITKMMIELGQKIDPLEFPKDLTPELINDAKDAGIGMRLSGVVATWAEAYRKAASNKSVEELDFIPEGFTLTTAQRREIVSPAGVREIAARYCLTTAEIDSAAKIALGKLETLIKTKAERGNKDALAKEFSDSLEAAGYVEKSAPYSFLKMTKGVKNEKKD